ncbi:MAG: hypothetical protein KI792_13615 [Alphaproteobacteria bacterium]|nr:hypothetical protein [Alphaproteobacteria bacterium SS10]
MTTPTLNRCYTVAVTALTLGLVLSLPMSAPLAQSNQTNTLSADGGRCEAYLGPTAKRPTRAWTQCDVDSDCVMTQSICDWPEAVAQTYQREHGQYKSCLAPVVDCALPPQSPVPHRAICQDRQCIAVPTGQ